jgi:hypothetical protein
MCSIHFQSFFFFLLGPALQRILKQSLKAKVIKHFFSGHSEQELRQTNDKNHHSQKTLVLA